MEPILNLDDIREQLRGKKAARRTVTKKGLPVKGQEEAEEKAEEKKE